MTSIKVNAAGPGGKDLGMARILIAEDDSAVREFVSRALRHQGHDVTAVEDGLHALERMAADSYDLLITDIVMPGLDGIALALKAGKDYPAMKILLMSGYASERQRAHNLDALAHRIIAKPFTLAEICAAVAETLAAE
jgi:CheY-like chemotaxis protein